MTFDEKQLLAELARRIKPPLATIRAALHRAGMHSENVKAACYIALADQAVSRIAEVLKQQDDRNAIPASRRRSGRR